MGFAKYYRWSDNDRRFGPFIYARDSRGYRPLALMLSSGKLEHEDSSGGCQIRISGFGHTLIIALPQIIMPWRRKVFPGWDADTIARLGRDWYWDSYSREFGISYHAGFVQVHFGAQTHDSSTTMDWCKHLPWTQWRHVRRSLFGLDGKIHAHIPERKRRLGDAEWHAAWDLERALEESCPSASFAFHDFDNEALTVKTRIEEREWRFGTGWFKWLSAFRAPRIRRYLDLAFSGETGKRKGSWKGGTLGHSIEMKPGELHEAAFRRYCIENNMTFKGAAQWDGKQG